MQIWDGESPELERQRRARWENEQRASSLLGTEAASVNVACECGHDDCAAELTVSRTAYRSLRRQAGWFLVQDGHERPDTHRVVRMDDTFVIVEAA